MAAGELAAIFFVIAVKLYYNSENDNTILNNPLLKPLQLLSRTSISDQ